MKPDFIAEMLYSSSPQQALKNMKDFEYMKVPAEMSKGAEVLVHICKGITFVSAVRENRRNDKDRYVNARIEFDWSQVRIFKWETKSKN